jgi:hypothetical protein
MFELWHKCLPGFNLPETTKMTELGPISVANNNIAWYIKNTNETRWFSFATEIKEKRKKEIKRNKALWYIYFGFMISYGNILWVLTKRQQRTIIAYWLMPSVFVRDVFFVYSFACTEKTIYAN